MTKVVVTLDKSQKVKRVFVSGHSNYDVIGKDIVCSSVSVAMYMSANLLSKVTENFKFIEDNKNTEMDLIVEEDNEFINIIMDNLVYTLQSISESYAKFLKIEINE